MSEPSRSDRPAGSDRTRNVRLYAGIGVVFEKAEGEKCERCWKVLPDVNTHKHPHTCARCNAALG